MADQDIVEHTLVMIPECFVFKLPPRQLATGWLAADMTEQMWTGRLKIVQRGKEAAILLNGKADGKLFAMCRIKEGAVDKVRDSSRYFVLKIESPDGRHAFIGLAFNDRNASFDFNVAMQEFQKDVAREAAIEKGGGIEAVSAAAAAPQKDLSLKDGEKIKMNVAGAAAGKRRAKKEGGQLGGGGGLFLAPPPGDTPSSRKLPGSDSLLGDDDSSPAPQTSSTAAFSTGSSSTGDGLSDWGMPALQQQQQQFPAAMSSNVQQQQQPHSSAAADPFGGFGGAPFGSGTAAQGPQQAAAASSTTDDPFGDYSF